ncbi:MAG: L-glutamate gamma-semialdehyde dehydrogenase [Deltaproteobacteria bacterium]|nr:L-glutamate gamma-semialdehyde dehydrogenase [Deltaproteobacteria bacterium]
MTMATVPKAFNEPCLSYAPGTPERTAIESEVAHLEKTPIEIPCRIGGKAVRTGKLAEVRAPHRHSLLLGSVHRGGREEVELAITAAARAKDDWEALGLHGRAAIFLRAADLLAGRYRPVLNAATMLGQSKTVHQAEIDSACELIDFFRFNVAFAERLYADQPISPPGFWNRMEYRPLEGFVLAVTPFNFTSIAGNLPTAPAIMGNTVLWKPASSAVYSAHFIMNLLEEAGLPPGVVNMVTGSGRDVGDPALSHPDLAGVHFTGSTATFQGMWSTIGKNIARYRSYPRIVGETGGKDFIFVHASADVDALATAVTRGSFEYQGQKCSACSRVYVPDSLWPAVRDRLLGMVSEIRQGDTKDFRNFMGAVIDEGAYESISRYLEIAREGQACRVLAGGTGSKDVGWFIPPTVVEVSDPRHRLMAEEIFGPVVTIFPYREAAVDEALELCDRTSPYALTGAVFATDRVFIERASKVLRNAAGNFYINDKPTGAVVGQQPFGGARASGTNDKAGSILNLVRWVSARSIKETFVPPRSFPYPFMGAE